MVIAFFDEMEMSQLWHHMLETAFLYTRLYSLGVKVAIEPKRLEEFRQISSVHQNVRLRKGLRVAFASTRLGNDDSARPKLSIAFIREYRFWALALALAFWGPRTLSEVDGVPPGKLSSSSTLVSPVR